MNNEEGSFSVTFLKWRNIPVSINKASLERQSRYKERPKETLYPKDIRI